MTSVAVTGEPPCTLADGDTASPEAGTRPLRAVRRAFDRVEPAAWDALADANPWATPFSRWAFHRAWWDGYGANAHEETLVLVRGRMRPTTRPPVAIAPLMHRHEVEPADAGAAHGDPPRRRRAADPRPAGLRRRSSSAPRTTPTTRRSWPRPADLPAVAEALAGRTAPRSGDPAHPRPWDVVDLRRLRCGDPAADALAAAFGAARDGRRAGRSTWSARTSARCGAARRRHDCDDYLATLGKKERHEIRRKVRRAEAAGEVRLDDVDDPLADLTAFIDLHQKRWGADGLFPDTEGGRAAGSSSAACSSCSAPTGPLKLAFLTVDGRRVAAGVSLRDRRRAATTTTPASTRSARELSPGVVMVRRYLRRAIERGIAPDRLPARRRALQVRVGRGGRADPAPARAADAGSDDAARCRTIPASRRWSTCPCPGAGASGSSRSWRRARTAAPRSTCSTW